FRPADAPLHGGARRKGRRQGRRVAGAARVKRMSWRVPTPRYAAAGKPGAPMVLFLHGIGGNRDSFAGELPRLAKRWRALAWDMPGYGGSPAVVPLTFEALAQSVIAALDAERAEKAVLVGHSLGGMIAQETAARFPPRVAGLVLFAT